jgi:hypothetical protein
VPIWRVEGGLDDRDIERAFWREATKRGALAVLVVLGLGAISCALSLSPTGTYGYRNGNARRWECQTLSWARRASAFARRALEIGIDGDDLQGT